MVVRTYGLRACAAMLLAAVVLGAGLGCSRKSLAEKAAEATNYKISGTVKYTRIPLKYDANGIPTGLETDTSKFTTEEARGIKLRIFQYRPQTDADNNTVYRWNLVANASTADDGTYSVSSGVLKDYLTFVELTTTLTQPASPASTVTIISDPDGVYSTTQITDRTTYVMRKSLDGSTSTTNATLSAAGTKDTVVDFTLGTTDSWMVVTPKWYYPYKAAFDYPETVVLGSRPLAILDSIYEFADIFGNAVPSSSEKELDLHYRPGVSARRGTFVEWRPELLPKSYDGSAYHFMGSVSAAGTVDGVLQSDDAYDTGVLYPLLGRNHMYGQGYAHLIPTGYPATSLTPDMALVEGFGDAMAVTLLERPWLPAGTGSNRYASVRDIRDLSALSSSEIGPFSAPAITSMVWDMALINGKITAPGTVAAWDAITAENFNRLYTEVPPTFTSGTATINSDVVNLMNCVARLQESKSSGDNSDLKTFFTDSVLTTLLATYNITWPGYDDAILPKYTTNWGTDPDSLTTALPSFNLSMSAATKIKRYYLDASNVEQVEDYYPNNSRNEVFYAICAFSLDHTYNLSATTVPALPSGASIEVVMDGDLENVWLFPAGSSSVSISFKGNPSDLTTPNWHFFRVRLLSPASLVPDATVTMHLEKVN